jgi:hypothetical protein
MAKLNQQRPIPPIVKAFGKEYCFQGAFDEAELKATRERWEKIGHKAMVKKGGLLYVTRFPQ